MKSWYKHTTDGGVFYCYNPKTTRQAVVVGDGVNLPTPKQIAEAYLKLKDEDFYRIEYIQGVFTATEKSTAEPEELPSGTYFYNVCNEDGIERLSEVSYRKDAYVEMSKTSNSILEDISLFLANESVYRQLNIIYKLGILLYGEPGTGKTSLIRTLVKKYLPSNAIIITISKSIPGVEFLKVLNESTKNRLKVFIFEEFTQHTQGPSDMEEVLTFLDGETSVDNAICIATTNYPEKLPGNIVDRPSRFDKLYKITYPDATERAILLKHYLMREATSEEVALTDKMSSAFIKEIALLCHIQKLTVKEAVEKIKAHRKVVKNEFSELNTIGFGE